MPAESFESFSQPTPSSRTRFRAHSALHNVPRHSWMPTMGPRAALLSLFALPLLAGSLVGCGDVARSAGVDEDPLRATYCHWSGKCLPPGKAPPIPEAPPSTFRPNCEAGALRCVTDAVIPGGGYQACVLGADGTLDWSAPQSTGAGAFCEDGALVELSPYDLPCPPGEGRSSDGVCLPAEPQELVFDVKTTQVTGRVLVDGQAPTWTGSCDAEGPALVVTLKGAQTKLTTELRAGCQTGFTFDARLPADLYTPSVRLAETRPERRVILPVDRWTGPALDAREGNVYAALDVGDAPAPRVFARDDRSISAPAMTSNGVAASQPPASIPVAVRLTWNGVPFFTTRRCDDGGFATVHLRHALGWESSLTVPCGAFTGEALSVPLAPGSWTASMKIEPRTAQSLGLVDPIELGSIEVVEGATDVILDFETTRVRARLLVDGLPFGAFACDPNVDAGGLRLRRGEAEGTLPFTCGEGAMFAEGLVQRGDWDVVLVPAAGAGWGDEVALGSTEVR